MRLQIKTGPRKMLPPIDVDDSISVFDLKKELSLYADVGVEPEYQKIVYEKKRLKNNDKLRDYNIDTKKFLQVTVLKRAEKLDEDEESVPPPSTNESPAKQGKVLEESITPSKSKPIDTFKPGKTDEELFKQPAVKITSPTPSTSKQDELVRNIVAMGYPEKDVRRALAASFNNPERAIEYLVEGIPTSPSTPECSSTNYNTDDVSPREYFQSHPFFRKLKRNIYQPPDLTDEAIKRAPDVDESILEVIDENPDEFLKMLIKDARFKP